MRRQPLYKPPVGEQRYIAPTVSPGGMVTVSRVERKRVYIEYPEYPAHKDCYYNREFWDRLPKAPPVPIPQRMDDWVGLQVINREPMRTGNEAFPAGTRFVVRSHHQGRLNLDLLYGRGGVARANRHLFYIVPPHVVLGPRCKIKVGWVDAGKEFHVLGPPITVGGIQWLPVRALDEDDPHFHKLDGLEPA